MRRGLFYLRKCQRPDGSWLPLWFGNQHAPDDENPTYGTARVLAAYRDLGMMNEEPARRGIAWLLAAQNERCSRFLGWVLDNVGEPSHDPFTNPRVKNITQ